MRLIGIRADGDAGAEAGMGHVYRSLAYARRFDCELPDAGVHFYMRDFREGVEKVRGEGFEVTVLPPRPTPDDFRAAFAKHPPDLLVIDTLGSSAELITAGREHADAIVTVDDLEPSAAECDVIVNGILWGTRLLPTPFGKARVFQGVDYVQVREQFAQAHARQREIAPKVRKIVITTGGADGRRFAEQFMQAMVDLPWELDVEVIAGPAHPAIESLFEEAKALSGQVKFSIVENTSEMAQHLSAADVALITGGTVMFESAACGTPAVIVSSYEHQVPQAEWFAKQNAALHLGYVAGKVDRRSICDAIAGLVEDPGQRRQMSQAGKRAVDGKGLDRFVSIVGDALGGLL